MTNYAIDITELWPPLKSFNAVRGARVLTPEAARDILTHSNHPRVMDELAAKTGQALAGGADYGLWREVVLGIVAGRAGRDTTREKCGRWRKRTATAKRLPRQRVRKFLSVWAVCAETCMMRAAGVKTPS